MSDFEKLINASDLIDWIIETDPEWCIGTVRSIVDHIEEMPSAQPERKEGRWIIQDHPATGWFRVLCSECGEDVTSNAPIIGFFPNAKCIWDFCPWCGAKMGGNR